MRTIFSAVLLALVGLTSLGPRSADAMHATPPPTPAQLVARAGAIDSTRRLLALSASSRGGSAAERVAARRALRAAAIERRDALAALMASDPAGMLAVAIPEETRRRLPSVVRGKVERDAEVEGVLEVLHVDHPTDSRFLYFVDTPVMRMELFTAKELPADATTGTRVRVRGKRIARALAFDGTAQSLQVLSLPLPNTLGVQTTAVLLVNFQDNPAEPFTPSGVHTVVFSSTSDFDREVSYQQTWLEGDVFGWFTVAVSSGACDYATLANQAHAAATAAGVNLTGYRRFVYVFPKNGCSWSGLGTVGGNPSRSWINGSLNMTVVAHEMGHNLGLYHSHSLACVGASCTTGEYGDTLDVMGRSVSGHYGAFQKERLGWLGTAGSPPITTVQATGTYALDPYEPSGTGPKALKILKSTDATTGARTWYYVELRRAIGFDAGFASSANLMNGVVVRTGSESSGNSTFLLDMTPETSSWYDPALTVGRSFSDAAAGISITPTSVGNGGAAVAVTVASTACVRGSMTVTLSPTTQLAAAGGETSSVVTITSGDSSACPASTVQLLPSAPAGWAASLTPVSLSVPANASTTSDLQLSVPTTVPAGDYPIAVSATSTGSSAPVVANGTVAVSAGLDVRVRTDRTTYPPSGYVFVTTLVTAGGAPAAGASTVVTLTRPNGATVTRTVSTDATGAAVASFRLRRAAPGTYIVSAVSTSAGAGALSGTGQSTFTVQ